jgi:hypothetical protein
MSHIIYALAFIFISLVFAFAYLGANSKNDETNGYNVEKKAETENESSNYSSNYIHPVKRIHFEPNRTGTVIRGSIVNPESFILAARKNQYMTVHITSSNNNVLFQIRKDNSLLTEKSTNDWQGVLPETGDYYIDLIPQNQADYTLEVSIR